MHGNGGYIIIVLEGIGKELKSWSKFKFDHFTNNKAQLQHAINSLHEQKNAMELSQKQKKLEGLLQKEEGVCRLRSRMNSLAQGDRNTRYFCHHASQQKKNNYIEGLLSFRVEMITD